MTYSMMIYFVRFVYPESFFGLQALRELDLSFNELSLNRNDTFRSRNIGLIVGLTVGLLSVFTALGCLAVKVIHSKKHNRVYNSDNEIKEPLEDDFVTEDNESRPGSIKIAWAKKHWWDEA
nr:hypothetical protein BaRGS_014659 [Batillaria attramentaria]